MEIAPGIELVQFVDGDCEIDPAWVARAMRELIAKPQAAAVCGRRRERFPDASIYNRLCDMEWNTPVGETRACGGDALVRVKAFGDVGGYDANVIAGEEPEMCLRMREKGWQIWRIDAEMTLHDAAMTRFNQWWKRNVRAGHSYAEGFAMHGAAPNFYRAREVRSNWIWGAGLPAGCGFAVLMLAFVAPRWTWLALLPLLFYPLLLIRIMMNRIGRGDSTADSVVYATSVMLGKIPQALGQLKYFRNKSRGMRSTIIEYKPAKPSAVVTAK
jgi:hypothetical protein